MTSHTNQSRSREVRLRSVADSDLTILFEHQREPEANNMAAFPARDREAFMAHWKKILGDASVVAMTVVVDNRVAGHVGSWKQDGKRLVGYWIGKEHWGQGVATEMLAMFLRKVVDRPLYAYVVKHNFASIRVLEKCGFGFCEKSTFAHDDPADGVEELLYIIKPAS
jgi:RimJ/RimL family protein N-acetyltransferase